MSTMAPNPNATTWQTQVPRSIYVDPSTNCFCTTDYAGRFIWIIDPSTGFPMTQRWFGIHQPSNCYYAINPITGQAEWIIDPLTGYPMVAYIAQYPSAPSASITHYQQRTSQIMATQQSPGQQGQLVSTARTTAQTPQTQTPQSKAFF